MNDLEVTVEKLVYGGAGLARVDGRVVLTPFVLPGELVRIELAGEKPGLAEARLREIVTPSPGRTQPPCPYFFRCGGCQYQHAAYEVQLEQKRAILQETLRRVGKIEAPGEIRVISGEPWQYRNRAQLHISGTDIGYFGFGTRRLVPIDHCPISSPRINEALGALRAMLTDRRRFPGFLRSIELFTNDSEVQVNVLETERPVSRRFFDWCAERLPGFVPGPIDYAAAGETYRVQGRSFFQVNRFLVGTMVDAALDGAAGDTALDLYAGVGLFSLPLARRFRRLTAVELGASAAADLDFNRDRAGVRFEIRRAPAEAFLETVETAPDFVLADPPRAGLGKAVVRQLLRLRPPRLTLVSCDPATLARDLAALTSGGFSMEALTLIDLFPQTFHIETVARLKWVF